MRRLEAAYVVNCLWDGRLQIDRQLNLVPKAPWVYRLKYRVLGRVAPALRALPSLTFVLGRYGDVVLRSDGSVYLSWYPTDMRGWSTDLAPPASWQPALQGQLAAAALRRPRARRR